jgi:hypothetical protein
MGMDKAGSACGLTGSASSTVESAALAPRRAGGSSDGGSRLSMGAAHRGDGAVGLCEGRHLRAASVLGPVLVSVATAVFAAGVWRLRPTMVVRAAAVRRSRRTLLVVAVGDAADVDERQWLRGLLSSLVECRRLAWTCASCSVVVWQAANKRRCAQGWHGSITGCSEPSFSWQRCVGDAAVDRRT